MKFQYCAILETKLMHCEWQYASSFFFPLFSFFFLMPIKAINTVLKKILLSSLKINYEIMHQNAAYIPTALQYTQWQCVGKSTVNIHFVTFSQFRKYRLTSKEKRKRAGTAVSSFIHSLPLLFQILYFSRLPFSSRVKC